MCYSLHGTNFTEIGTSDIGRVLKCCSTGYDYTSQEAFEYWNVDVGINEVKSQVLSLKTQQRYAQIRIELVHMR